MELQPASAPRFPWKMAWRDSRSSRSRLLLFISSMIFGVAALVAIASFGENLERAIDDQARTLLGADLSIGARAAFSEEAEALIDSIGGERSRQVSFASMAYFPESGGTRLVQVRALEGGYPYYGELLTAPAAAARRYQQEGGALVDESLLLQFGAQVGDSVRIGERGYRISGRLQAIPGEAQAALLFGPRIYLPLDRLDPKLLDRGSRVEYDVFFKLPPRTDAEALRERIDPFLKANSLSSDTVRERQEDFGEGLANLYRFLSLVGFIALVLGGIGVASAIHVYVKQKLATVAVLRCVGARARQTFAIYLIQAAAMGLAGAVLGALLGAAVQTLVPVVLRDLLPVEVSFSLSWRAILEGLLVGLGVALLFALLPLLAVRKTSPLLALRSSFEEEAAPPDPLRWLVYALIAGGLTGFAVLQAGDPLIGLWYAAGLGTVFGLLALLARGLTRAVRRFFPASWPYVWRQGLANLYRPNNQTVILVLALGLGTFLIMTLYLTQRALLDQVTLAATGEQPNLVLFDVQPDQREGVAGLVREEGMPLLQQVPIVTMRIARLKGRAVEEMQADTTDDRIPRWALRREYRSTYLDTLTTTETVLSGEWTGRVPPGATPAPISLEQEIAGDLGVAVGDTIEWDVQGVPVVTTVGSIREVNWRRVQPNFFAVFPAGVLEQAPQFFVIVSRSDSTAQAARLQRAVVRQYPNVSAIDLELVLSTVDQILSQQAFVIRFMALFSIITGLFVLAGAVVTSRFQRIRESVLLRTLGASRRQIVRIMIVEYLALGGLAALAGLVLANAASWALVRFLFELRYAPPFLPMLAAIALVAAVTILIGLAASRGVTNRPPLEVLRVEA